MSTKYSNLFPYVGEFTAFKGSNTKPSIHFIGDETTGLYSSADSVIDFVSGGINVVKVDSTLEGLGGIDISGVARSSLIYVDDGSVESPSITFKNDKDTGFYRKAEDTIGLTVNGSDTMTVQHQGSDLLTFKSSVVFESLTSIRIPGGPTGYRPVAEAKDGDIRYNTTTRQFEGYSDGEWLSFGRPKNVNNVNPVEEPDGILTTFTLPNSHEYVGGTLQVFVNGLLEDDISFTSSTQFTIPDPAPEAGDIITICYTRRDHY